MTMTIRRRCMPVVLKVLQEVSRFADTKKTIMIADTTSNDNGEELG
jgi:hypothetical protein